MRFSTSIFAFGLAATALAMPFDEEALGKRANATAAAGGSVLVAQSYADFQISDGVAGNAQAEVMAKFPVSPSPGPHSHDSPCL